MSVLLPDLSLTVNHRSHPFVRDAYNSPVPGAVTTSSTGPFPGRAREDATDNVWSIALDTRHDPVEPGDEVTDGSRVWTVTFARIHYVTGHPDADYIEATGTLNPPEVP